ncbi:hypothetical protein ASU33_00150 [Solirubrum puertoriconensis]|uniref:Uncharacterized protein n=2 Tax=Solirubrum puertoriconensis TaxID=1751427 RepID=A0A9X0HHB1_SOLP1|nr:hypothetical protein ASU33_00150 [Solirubrum puertoriconensis]
MPADTPPFTVQLNLHRMRPSFLFSALLAGAALAFSAAPARAQVTINIGRPAPPPVVVVREVHPVKYKHKKHRHHYRAQPVMLVPAQPVYYGPKGGHRGRGHGHGRH